MKISTIKDRLTKITLSKFGWFAFVYYSVFALIGINALQSLYVLVGVKNFANLWGEILYIASWIIVYPVAAFMCAKLLIQNAPSRLTLTMFSFIWFLASFWFIWIFILGGPANIKTGLGIAYHIMLAYPNCYLLSWEGIGLILVFTPPVINLTLFLIAWKRPQWFYRNNIELET
ncbi:MAG: hypothetical protein BA863_07925 [Desulfovibrio sp. S3730MH75]|nr:MAG: hypothetical protein BA863_07925 [Desulfovibrio sp. S3730MH75]